MIQPLSTSSPTALYSPSPVVSREAQEAFAQVISRATGAGDQSPEARARAAAEQLVSTALVQPVLKQMRETSQAAPPFAPGQGERTFRGLMDAGLAHKMVKSGSWGLVDRLAHGMLKRMGIEAPPGAAPMEHAAQ